MSVNLNSNQHLLNDLNAIASQAYGHGVFEKESGGMGYMGLMKSADGTVSVFKCLTHSKEYTAFENSVKDDMDVPKEYTDLKVASQNLKNELMRLGADAGMNFDELNHLEEVLNNNGDMAKGYLSRKMVAKAVTEIAKKATGTTDAKDFWKGVKFTGTVKNTKLSAMSEAKGNTINFETNAQTHITKLGGVKAESNEAIAAKNTMPKDYNDFESRIDSGDIGTQMMDVLKESFSAVIEKMPKFAMKHAQKTSIAFQSDGNAMIALLHSPDKDVFGRETLADPKKLTGMDRAVAKFFQLSLKSAMNEHKNMKQANGDSNISEQDIKNIFQQAIVRTAIKSACLEVALKAGEEKGLSPIFREFMLEEGPTPLELSKNLQNDTKDDAKTEDELAAAKKTRQEAVDDIMGKISNVLDTQLRRPKNVNGDELQAYNFMSGSPENYGDNSLDDGSKASIRKIVKNLPSFAYSEIKCAFGDQIHVPRQQGVSGEQNAWLGDEKWMFSRGNPSGEDIANEMFEQQ